MAYVNLLGAWYDTCTRSTEWPGKRGSPEGDAVKFQQQGIPQSVRSKRNQSRRGASWKLGSAPGCRFPATPGARPIDADPDLLVSPCDAIVGAAGRAEAGRILQIKGFPYRLRDLLGDDALAELYRGGCYVTLRLTSAMYHHFHAPHDCRMDSVTYISDGTWNVNPIALKRVENLFRRNERAVIKTRLSRAGHAITLVPVAAILVASIRLNFLDTRRGLRHGGPRTIPCDTVLCKGEAMGWFEHGSTIILFAPDGFALHESVSEGLRIRVGQPLMRLPRAPHRIWRPSTPSRSFCGGPQTR